MSDLWAIELLPAPEKQVRRRNVMTSISESRVQAWNTSMSVGTQAQQLVQILAGTLGVVLVTLMTWLVLLVVR